MLLIVVATAHLGYDPISSLYEHPLAAAKAWHSVLRALESTVLYLTVWALTPWKPLLLRYGVSAVCAWGALESFQIAACRLALPMDRPPPNVPNGASVCDAVTGWPIYFFTAAVILLLAVLSIIRNNSD